MFIGSRGSLEVCGDEVVDVIGFFDPAEVSRAMQGDSVGVRQAAA
jgi:hypothetical protein